MRIQQLFFGAKHIAIILSIGVLLSGTACGRKSAPEPPEAYAPTPVQFLQAEGLVGAVLLRWQAPTLDEKGEKILELEGYTIMRSNYEQDSQPNYKIIAEVSAPEQAAEATTEIVELTFKDDSVQAGAQYQYKVLPVDGRGVKGRPATILRVTYAGQASVIESVAPDENDL